MRLFARVFLLCLSLFSVPSIAATVNDLYQVREPVASNRKSATRPCCVHWIPWCCV